MQVEIPESYTTIDKGKSESVVKNEMLHNT